MTSATHDADRIASRDIRNTLVIARQAQGHSLEHVAAFVGCSFQQLSRWENGTGGIPTIDSLARWADALGYDIALLAKEDDRG